MKKKYIEKLNNEQREFFSLNFLYAQHQPLPMENIDELELSKGLIASSNNNTRHVSYDLYKNYSTPISDFKDIKSTLEVI